VVPTLLENRPDSIQNIVLTGETIALQFPTRKEFEEIARIFKDPKTFPALNPDELYLKTEDRLALFIRLAALPSRIQMATDLSRDLVDDPGRSFFNVLQLQKPTRLPFVIKPLRGDTKRMLGVIMLEVSIVQRVGIVRTIILPDERRKVAKNPRCDVCQRKNGNHIDHECHRKGYGHRAKCLILQLAFVYLGLDRVESQLLYDNRANLVVNERLGFVHEGVRRKHALIMGTRKDVLIMGMLEDDWRKHIQSQKHQTQCDGQLSINFHV